MFVRIILSPSKEEDTSDEVYQCRHVQVRSFGEESMLLIIEGHENGPDERRVVVPKDRGYVYLMNDQGQTIDSYRWS